MTLNHHFGVPNSKALFSGWRFNSLLGRKPLAAGYLSKTQPPVHLCTELVLDLMLTANILDAFRLHCGRKDKNLDTWVKALKTPSQLHTVSRKVIDQLASGRRVSDLRKLPPQNHDIEFENIILFNRDALILLTLRSAVKRGDVGSVVNVLHYWMLMFRGTGKMPKYADTMYGALAELKRMDPAAKYVNHDIHVSRTDLPQTGIPISTTGW